MTTRSALDLRVVLTVLTIFLPLACGKSEAEAGGPSRTEPSPSQAKSAAKVEPFVYPAPVSGHFKEVNTGDFDLVDGLAYTANAAGDTVVYVTSEQIASPVLSDSSCPMTDARAIALIRDASYLEVTLDKSGKSSYFAKGTQFGGQGREEDSGGKYWKIEQKQALGGRTAGSVVHKNHGSFTFDLPIVKPGITEVSQGDRVHGRRTAEDAPTPDEAAVLDTYRAMHKAAKAKDLAALLAAQGFSERQITAIRGLPGIDADFALFADRFLDPGEPGDATCYQGYGGIGGKGVNSQGKKFSNYYEFMPCGKRVVLIGISESPQ